MNCGIIGGLILMGFVGVFYPRIKSSTNYEIQSVSLIYTRNQQHNIPIKQWKFDIPRKSTPMNLKDSELTCEHAVQSI